MAPILSFTADEVWQHIPGERSDSVHLERWYEGLFTLEEVPAVGMDRAFWQQLIAVREAVSHQLEALRVAGDIGSSLDAVIDLYGSEQALQQLQALQDELRFVLLTSEARLHIDEAAPADAVDLGDGVSLLASASTQAKCVRCWHHRDDVGAHVEHPELCGRCVDNVAGSGEQRRYA